MAKDKSFYLKTKRDECATSLFCDSDRGALETVMAHFESHPAMSGEKTVKDRVNELLDNPGLLEGWDPDGSEREFIAEAYGKTRIRETRIENRTDVSMFRMKTKEFGTYTQQDNPTPVCVKKADVELRKIKDGVNIYAQTTTNNRYQKIGSLPDSFLANNPMNVSRCPAVLSVEDFSGGKNEEHLRADRGGQRQDERRRRGTE